MTAAVVIKYAIELVAVLLLALGIKGLSKVRSARAAINWLLWPWPWLCWAY